MEVNSQKPFIIVDGSSFLFRAFHALPQLTNGHGEPTGAIYGVANMMRKLLNDHHPDHVAMVFDHSGKTFRNDLYPLYKANRGEMPDELRVQIEPLKSLLISMGFTLLILENVEADDVIGSLVKMNEHETKIIIVTGDKDLAQLVNSQVTLSNTMNDVVLDEAGVFEKFGVTPAQFIDYLTLVGDTSDNIPGVPSVGPKTAAKWLQTYGSLENILLNIADIKGKVREKLAAFIPQIALTQQLVTIKCDVIVPERDTFLLRQPDLASLPILLERFRFRKWLDEVSSHQQEEKKEQITHYETILTESQLQHWIEKLNAAPYFSFDTETDSLNYLEAQLMGVSFAISSTEAAYIPLQHQTEIPQLPLSLVLNQLKPLLENFKPKIIMQHAKYDMHVLANYGIAVNGLLGDTLLMSHLLNSTGRHDLKTLSEKYLQRETKSYEELTGKGKKQIPFSEIALADATAYAGDDAAITYALSDHLLPLLKQDGVLKVLSDIELPLIPVLCEMERHGVLLDISLLKKQSDETMHLLTVLETQAYALAGQDFNLQSPKQLQEILYEKMQLPVLEKTPTGQPSTAEEVLQQLSQDYELPKIILEHRHFSKLKSTYLDALPEQVNIKTGRVHTSYHQGGTNTGRLSSSDPNLQNIPIRSEAGRRIRQAFIAAPGCCLVAADYSQIELRIMAHLSEDAGLLKAFHGGEDIHRATAAEVFSVPLNAVSDDQRRSAKAINFGLLYGMSAFGLAKQLGTDRKAADAYVELYFARYPGVKEYMDRTRQQAHEQGYVTTLFGRRLWLPEINARQIQRQKASERAAINAPMQGTAADIIKRAMISISVALKRNALPAHLIMQVHDELVFEVANDAVNALCDLVQTHMVNAATLRVPLVVDIGVGNNWDEAH